MFLVPREGLEPPTVSLERSCSIQLSYQGVPHKIADFGGKIKRERKRDGASQAGLRGARLRRDQ